MPASRSSAIGPDGSPCSSPSCGPFFAASLWMTHQSGNGWFSMLIIPPTLGRAAIRTRCVGRGVVAHRLTGLLAPRRDAVRGGPLDARAPLARRHRCHGRLRTADDRASTAGHPVGLARRPRREGSWAGPLRRRHPAGAAPPRSWRRSCPSGAAASASWISRSRQLVNRASERALFLTLMAPLLSFGAVDAAGRGRRGDRRRRAVHHRDGGRRDPRAPRRSDELLMVLFYLDIRVRTEGLDLALRAPGRWDRARDCPGACHHGRSLEGHGRHLRPARVPPDPQLVGSDHVVVRRHRRSPLLLVARTCRAVPAFWLLLVAAVVALVWWVRRKLSGRSWRRRRSTDADEVVPIDLDGITDLGALRSAVAAYEEERDYKQAILFRYRELVVALMAARSVSTEPGRTTGRSGSTWRHRHRQRHRRSTPPPTSSR